MYKDSKLQKKKKTKHTKNHVQRNKDKDESQFLIRNHGKQKTGEQHL